MSVLRGKSDSEAPSVNNVERGYCCKYSCWWVSVIDGKEVMNLVWKATLMWMCNPLSRYERMGYSCYTSTCMRNLWKWPMINFSSTTLKCNFYCFLKVSRICSILPTPFEHLLFPWKLVIWLRQTIHVLWLFVFVTNSLVGRHLNVCCELYGTKTGHLKY